MDFAPRKETPKMGDITIIYGEANTHKTTIMASAIKDAKKGIVIPIGEDSIGKLQTDRSYGDLKDVEVLNQTIKTWRKHSSFDGDVETVNINAGLIDVCGWLSKQDYTAIGFDSLSLIGQALLQYTFQTNFIDLNTKGKSIAELQNHADGFGGSPLMKPALKEWQTFLRFLTMMREKGVDIFITCHTKEAKARLLGDELEYNRVEMDFPSCKGVDFGNSLLIVSDATLYAERSSTVFRGDKVNSAKLASAPILHVTSTSYYDAKNRFMQTEPIDATWEAVKGMLTGEIAEQKKEGGF